MFSVQCKLNNFTAISCREKVIFEGDDDAIHFILEQNEYLKCYIAS